jgi:hypothetical protein
VSQGELDLGEDLTKQDHAKHQPGAHPVYQRTANHHDN